MFTPLAALPPILVDVAWEVASVAALAWSCVLALKLAGWRPPAAMVAAVVGASLLLEPMYHTLYLGQINLILLALVMTDIWRTNDWLGAAAVTGTTGLLVSPISWTHHWVWIMPALIVLLRGGTGSRIAAACGYLLFVLAPM